MYSLLGEWVNVVGNVEIESGTVYWVLCQVLSNAREIKHRWDFKRSQICLIANARMQENVWRAYGSSSKDDFLCRWNQGPRARGICENCIRFALNKTVGAQNVLSPAVNSTVRKVSPAAPVVCRIRVTRVDRSMCKLGRAWN